jgi:hypothetical protein
LRLLFAVKTAALLSDGLTQVIQTCTAAFGRYALRVIHRFLPGSWSYASRRRVILRKRWAAVLRTKELPKPSCFGSFPLKKTHFASMRRKIAK